MGGGIGGEDPVGFGEAAGEPGDFGGLGGVGFGGAPEAVGGFVGCRPGEAQLAVGIVTADLEGGGAVVVAGVGTEDLFAGVGQAVLVRVIGGPSVEGAEGVGFPVIVEAVGVGVGDLDPLEDELQLEDRARGSVPFVGEGGGPGAGGRFVEMLNRPVSPVEGAGFGIVVEALEDAACTGGGEEGDAEIASAIVTGADAETDVFADEGIGDGEGVGDLVEMDFGLERFALVETGGEVATVVFADEHGGDGDVVGAVRAEDLGAVFVVVEDGEGGAGPGGVGDLVFEEVDAAFDEGGFAVEVEAEFVGGFSDEDEGQVGGGIVRVKAPGGGAAEAGHEPVGIRDDDAQAVIGDGELE